MFAARYAMDKENFLVLINVLAGMEPVDWVMWILGLVHCTALMMQGRARDVMTRMANPN